MTTSADHDLDAPLIIRRSRLKIVLGLAFGVLGVSVMMTCARGSPASPPPFFPAIFLVICLTLSVIELVDRRPRLVIERDGLRWPTAFGPLVRAAWDDVQIARIREDLRNHGSSWLELTLAPGAGDRREISIKLDRLTLEGDEIQAAIRARAPHLFPRHDDTPASVGDDASQADQRTRARITAEGGTRS